MEMKQETAPLRATRKEANSSRDSGLQIKIRGEESQSRRRLSAVARDALLVDAIVVRARDRGLGDSLLPSFGFWLGLGCVSVSVLALANALARQTLAATAGERVCATIPRVEREIKVNFRSFVITPT